MAITTTRRLTLSALLIAGLVAPLSARPYGYGYGYGHGHGHRPHRHRRGPIIVIRAPRPRPRVVVVPAPAPIPHASYFVPPEYTPYPWGGAVFYYRSGIFHRHDGRRFVACAAPVGLVVRTIPTAHRLHVNGGRLYYVVGDTYYQRASGGYVVVHSPTVVTVPAAPPAPSYPTVPAYPAAVGGTTSGAVPRSVGGSVGAPANPAAVPAYPGYPAAVDAPPAPDSLPADLAPLVSPGDDEGSTQPGGHTVYLELANGSRVEVELTRDADGSWVGPKGEYYDDFPTAEQLRKLYAPDAPPITEAAAAGPEQTVIWVTNSNGSRTEVARERTAGGSWKGPQGETYATFPTEEQLVARYGLK